MRFHFERLSASNGRFNSIVSRILFIAICFLATQLSSSAQNTKPAPKAANSRPNVIIILADDLGYGDLRSYNAQSKIPTPNLDKLAAQGMRFTDAHTPSSVCTPTRYGLLTGRYAWRTKLKKGVLDGYSPLLIEPGRMTIASLLRQQGYATAGFGKWHLGLGETPRTNYSQPLVPGTNSVGFDYFFGIPASLDMPPYLFFENDTVPVAPTETIAGSEMRRKGGGGYWRAGAISPGFAHENVLPTLTEKVVSFIEKQSSEKPFFLYLPLNAPHTPWMPTKEFRGKSGADWYGDFVVQVDDAVGRVLQALSNQKLDGNTLVIFTSDNGAHWLPGDIEKWGHRANDGLRGQKADIWEGGHRVPFIARWPGKVKPGSASHEMIGLTDLLATIAAVNNVTLPHDAAEDSFNFLPILLGQKLKRPIRETIIHHSIDGTFGIRQREWKLAMALGSHGFSDPREITANNSEAKGQLYNLKDDPAEQQNLWLQKPQVVAQLSALLKKYQDEGRSR